MLNLISAHDNNTLVGAEPLQFTSGSLGDIGATLAFIFKQIS